MSKQHEIHTLSKKAGFSSMKEELAADVQKFLNQKASQGYEVINVSFAYYQNIELVAFITICKE